MMGATTMQMDTMRMLDLRLKGMTYAEIAELAQVDTSTICRRLNRLEAILGDPEQVAIFRERRTDLYAAIQGKLLAEIVKPEKLEKLSGYQAAGMQHYFWEQERIEQGKSGSLINQLTILIDNGQDSGDKALRKLGLDSDKPNVVKRTENQTEDNSYTDAEVVPDK